jgi:hypothetical protein
LLKDFESVSTSNKLLSSFETDVLKTIQELRQGNGLRHSKIHVYYLPDEEKQYLSIEKVFIEGQGKGKKNTVNVIDNYKIDKAVAKSILESYENKKERFYFL